MYDIIVRLRHSSSVCQPRSYESSCRCSFVRTQDRYEIASHTHTPYKSMSYYLILLCFQWVWVTNSYQLYIEEYELLTHTTQLYTGTCSFVRTQDRYEIASHTHTPYKSMSYYLILLCFQWVWVTNSYQLYIEEYELLTHTTQIYTVWVTNSYYIDITPQTVRMSYELILLNFIIVWVTISYYCVINEYDSHY